MGSAPVRKDSASKTASAQRRGSTSSGGGSYGVGGERGDGVSDGGNQEVFVEPYDEAVSFARGYPHITFDPDGTYTPAP